MLNLKIKTKKKHAKTECLICWFIFWGATFMYLFNCTIKDGSKWLKVEDGLPQQLAQTFNEP